MLFRRFSRLFSNKLPGSKRPHISWVFSADRLEAPWDERRAEPVWIHGWEGTTWICSGCFGTFSSKVGANIQQKHLVVAWLTSSALNSPGGHQLQPLCPCSNQSRSHGMVKHLEQKGWQKHHVTVRYCREKSKSSQFAGLNLATSRSLKCTFAVSIFHTWGLVALSGVPFWFSWTWAGFMTKQVEKSFITSQNSLKMQFARPFGPKLDYFFLLFFIFFLFFLFFLMFCYFFLFFVIFPIFFIFFVIFLYFVTYDF